MMFPRSVRLLHRSRLICQCKQHAAWEASSSSQNSSSPRPVQQFSTQRTGSLDYYLQTARTCAPLERLHSTRSFSAKQSRSNRGASKKRLAKQYTSKIKNAPSWQQSLMVMHEMESKGIEIDVFHFSAAIAVCGKKKPFPTAPPFHRH